MTVTFSILTTIPLLFVFRATAVCLLLYHHLHCIRGTCDRFSRHTSRPMTFTLSSVSSLASKFIIDAERMMIGGSKSHTTPVVSAVLSVTADGQYNSFQPVLLLCPNYSLPPCEAHLAQAATSSLPSTILWPKLCAFRTAAEYIVTSDTCTAVVFSFLNAFYYQHNFPTGMCAVYGSQFFVPWYESAKYARCLSSLFKKIWIGNKERSSGAGAGLLSPANSFD